MKNKKFLIILVFAIFTQIFTLLFEFKNVANISNDLETYKKKIIVGDFILRIHFEERSGYQKLYFNIDNYLSLKQKVFNRIYIYFEPLGIKIFY